MAHEIEQMFSVVEKPWHGLGTVVENAPSVQDAIKLAGLDWTVEKQSILTASGIPVNDNKALVRSSDQSILGVVGNRYTPLQNTDAFSFFNPFIDQGLATLETAGSLREGKRIWILARLNNAPIEITKTNGDVIQAYLLLSNSHDGKLAVRIGFTPIRVVCANTLSAAHGNSESKLIRVWHGKDVKQNVDDLQSIVDATNAEFVATTEKYKYLASKQINTQDLEKYVRQVFSLNDPKSEREKIMQARLTTRIEELFKFGKGNTGKTFWDAYNGLTEFLNFEGTIRQSLAPAQEKQDIRLDKLWFGQSKTLNDKALDVALKIAG